MRIAAVVVTYNRINSLKVCITSIRTQTRRPEEIVVVNNGSTDATVEWLRKQDDLTVITQENLGSGGGQKTGIEYAYKKGHDWIWTMDDDGFPEENCLERLIAHMDEADVLNPLVLSVEDRSTFSFGCWVIQNGGRTLYKKKEYLIADYLGDVLIPSMGSPFNGTLFAREVISRCGFPRAELFIWGDEKEYAWRLNVSGVKSFVVRDSIFYHPHDPFTYDVLSIPFRNWWKVYYLLRNDIEIIRLRYPPLLSEMIYLKRRLRDLLMIVLHAGNEKRKKIRVLIVATAHGLTCHFGKYEIGR